MEKTFRKVFILGWSSMYRMNRKMFSFCLKFGENHREFVAVSIGNGFFVCCLHEISVCKIFPFRMSFFLQMNSAKRSTSLSGNDNGKVYIHSMDVMVSICAKTNSFSLCRIYFNRIDVTKIANNRFLSA